MWRLSPWAGTFPEATFWAIRVPTDGADAGHVVARVHRAGIPEIVAVHRAEQHDLDHDAAPAGLHDERLQAVEIGRVPPGEVELAAAVPGTGDGAARPGNEERPGAGASVLPVIPNEPGTSR